MPTSADKSTISAVVPLEIKERLKAIAKAKMWSVSQTAGLILEECLHHYESEIKEKPKRVSKPPKPK